MTKFPLIFDLLKRSRCEKNIHFLIHKGQFFKLIETKEAPSKKYNVECVVLMYFAFSDSDVVKKNINTSYIKLGQSSEGGVYF